MLIIQSKAEHVMLGIWKIQNYIYWTSRITRPMDGRASSPQICMNVWDFKDFCGKKIHKKIAYLSALEVQVISNFKILRF